MEVKNALDYSVIYIQGESGVVVSNIVEGVQYRETQIQPYGLIEGCGVTNTRVNSQVTSIWCNSCDTSKETFSKWLFVNYQIVVEVV